jgi:CheY-like chemotaxis protein/signal transduction histidine kinase
MHLLPFTLRLSLLAFTCALVLSGFALAGAAFTRDSELVVLAAALFLLVAAGSPLVLGRQIRQFLYEQERYVPEQELASDDFSVFEEVTVGKAEPEAPFLLLEETLSSESDDEEALRRMQKAQAVDRLRDGITHDLNNRLMVISANIDAVARQMKDQPVMQRKLLSALVASDQAAKLIAQSTAFARQHEPRVQYVDVAERVSSVATLMSRSMLRDTVELRLSVEEGLWPIEADPDDIETAIVTLSAHVRDALRQGGMIVLEAQNVHIQKGSLSDLTLAGDFVQLAIRSTSPGEARHDPEVGSEQTFTLRDLDLSSWLNLSQSLHFLQALGGASEVRRDGGETMIVLYLPRANVPALLPFGSLSDDDAISEDVPAQTEVLIVDDELEVALAFQSTLEEFGYVTSIATDAGQAMKSLSARKPGIVLTDVTMPGTMNGVMLARKVRQIYPDLPVLLITGNPVVADEESEFPLLQKPIISRDLHAAIQRHLMPQDNNKIVPLFPRASQRRG